MITPLAILFFFVMYPIVTLAYLARNKDKMLNPLDEDFIKRHGAVFTPFKLSKRWSLSFTLVANYRRLAYSIVIVLLADKPAHQL